MPNALSPPAGPAAPSALARKLDRLAELLLHTADRLADNHVPAISQAGTPRAGSSAVHQVGAWGRRAGWVGVGTSGFVAPAGTLAE